MSAVRISSIQGPGVLSPLGGQTVRTQGVVTGHTRKGFFIQDPRSTEDPAVSDAIFVFARAGRPALRMLVEISGRVLDYVAVDDGRPSTQIKEFETLILENEVDTPEPFWLTAELLSKTGTELTAFLNGLESMMVGVRKGAFFAAPSNPFGDYVVVPAGLEVKRSRHGGVMIDPSYPHRWLPSFRITDYDAAPIVNVGAELLSDVFGPLNYRASAFQILCQGSAEVSRNPVRLQSTRLKPSARRLTVLTLNGFNLDAHVEDPAKVNDPSRDVDDDVGDRRYLDLAHAVVSQAGCPDIVALQEMQDDDGAELSEVVTAEENYALLASYISKVGGPDYSWIDIPPGNGEDGGQPGGNIRNAYLYNPERVELVDGELRRLGEEDPCYEGSRKPLLARFMLKDGGASITLINVHLASKRQQRSLFAPEKPAFDLRLATRVAQARVIREELLALRAAGLDYYVTGDFNDFEFSETLRALLGNESVNLVETLSADDRYDYNHRGLSQVLMHGIVSKELHSEGRAEYEILHGNELIGVRPGQLGGKPTDHAYVLARLELS